MIFKIGDRVKMGPLTGVVVAYFPEINLITVAFGEGRKIVLTGEGKYTDSHKTPILELIEHPPLMLEVEGE